MSLQSISALSFFMLANDPAINLNGESGDPEFDKVAVGLEVAGGSGKGSGVRPGLHAQVNEEQSG